MAPQRMAEQQDARLYLACARQERTAATRTSYAPASLGYFIILHLSDMAS
jgi:hypothetical protein